MTNKIRVTLIAAVAALSLGTISLPLLYAQDARPPRGEAEESWRAPAPRGAGEGRREGRRPPPPPEDGGMDGMAPPPPRDGGDDRPEPPRIQSAIMRGKMAVEKIRRDEREIEQRKKALEGDAGAKLAPETLKRRKRMVELRTELLGLEKAELLDRVKETTAKGLEELDERAADAPEGSGPAPEMLERVKERLTKVQESAKDFDSLAKALDEMGPPEGGPGFRGPGGPDDDMQGGPGGGRGGRRFGPPGEREGGPDDDDGPMMGGRPPRGGHEERERGFAGRGPADQAQMERIEREMEMLNHRIERLQQQMGQMGDRPDQAEKRAERKAAKKGAATEAPVIEGVPPSATEVPAKK